MRMQSRLGRSKPGPENGPDDAERAAEIENGRPAAEQVAFAKVAGELHHLE